MDKNIEFGQFRVNSSQVFFRSKKCLGLVNLMPVVPGHVLLIPKRKILRYSELLEEELFDLSLSLQKVSNIVEKVYSATSLTMAIQDGKEAGQTVEHVHVHIMPRKKGDFEKNDDIYIEIEKPERRRRTEEEMKEEATMLSKYFEEQNQKFSLFKEED